MSCDAGFRLAQHQLEWCLEHNIVLRERTAHDTVEMCHAGPFAIVNGTTASTGATDAGSAESSTVVTHLAPHKQLPDLEHTVKFFPLALSLFEGQLGASFPFPSYHQASTS